MKVQHNKNMATMNTNSPQTMRDHAICWAVCDLQSQLSEHAMIILAWVSISGGILPLYKSAENVSSKVLLSRLIAVLYKSTDQVIQQ